MTKKEIAELVAKVEEFLPELKSEIDAAKADLRSARAVKTQLESTLRSSEEYLEKLQDPSSGVDAKLAGSVTNLAAITSSSESAQTLLASMQSALDIATKHVEEMEAVYATFNEQKNRINNPETGLEITFTNIKQIRARAKESATKAESILKTAENALVQIQNYIDSVNKAYDLFLVSKKKIDDPTDGLEAILTATKNFVIIFLPLPKKALRYLLKSVGTKTRREAALRILISTRPIQRRH